MIELLCSANMQRDVFCDSAGTAGYHIGARPDPRTLNHAERRGFDLPSRARKFNVDKDFAEFDLILAMDRANLRDLKNLCRGMPEYVAKVKLLCDYRQKLNYEEVPDPYYGEAADFELVLDIVEDACEGLLKELKIKNA